MADEPLTGREAKRDNSEDVSESRPFNNEYLTKDVKEDSPDSDPLDNEVISPTHLQAYPDRVVAYVQSLKSRYKRITHLYLQARDDVKKLNRELSQIRASHAELELDYADLNERMNKALSALANLRRDKSTSYVADLGPQNHIVSQGFKVFGDQELHHVATEIYVRLSAFDQEVITKRKVVIAELKSILSTEIFIKGRGVVEARNMSSKPVTDIIVNNAVEAINRKLGREILNSVSSPLNDMLKDLVSKGEDLIDKALHAEPPGEFWVAPLGEEFDPERYEPILGCEDSGRVTLTVFPGYSVGGRVYSKAQVRTSE
jgi:hypothetical protein